MEPKPALKIDNPQRELEGLLAQVEFDHKHPAFREGYYWSIYVEPLLTDHENVREALLAITSRSPEAESVEGIRVSLCQGKARWLPAGIKTTNRHGLVRFKNLSLGSFSVLYRGCGATEDREKILLAAKPLEDPNRTRSEPVRCIVDPHTTAWLEEGATGEAVLSVETEDKTYAGKSLQFEVAGEQGTISLEPTQPPGAWSGYRHLHIPFTEAIKTDPVISFTFDEFET